MKQLDAVWMARHTVVPPAVKFDQHPLDEFDPNP